MGIFFDISEVFQFAIRIEENGEAFYRKVAELSENEKIKELFIYLADEEVGHKKIFTKMLEGITDYEPSESYPGEYFQYLRSYADSQIFPPAIEKELNASSGLMKAIDFSINREMASIMYYLDLKNFVNKTQHQTLDKIISEERNHFLKLSKMKEQMQKA